MPLATSVSLTGANTTTATEATALAALTGFALGSGATVVVVDNVANLLAAGNASGEVVATSVSLSETNMVTAAQATTMVCRVGMPAAFP